MGVERLHAEPVVDDDAVAVDAQIGRVHDHAAVRGGDRRLLRRGEVEAEMRLLVDLLALEEVGAMIGETRLHLRVAELRERLGQRISGAVLAASAAIVWLFCWRRSRLMVRNAGSRSAPALAVRPSEGVFEAMAGTTRSRNARSIGMRERWKRFGNGWRSIRAVVSLPASSLANTVTGVAAS